MFAFCVAFTVILLATGYSAPVNDDGSIDENSVDVTKHLSDFGYLPPIDPGNPQLISDEELSNAVTDYQRYMGLSVTGRLDATTRRQMAKPRCGVQDKDAPSRDGPNEFRLGNSKWKKRTVTYKITKYPTNFPRDATERTIREAFEMWSKVSPLRFVRKNSGRVNIEIRFEKGAHGDRSPFDGPGRVLGHAYYPIIARWGGDAHFDDSERWSINSRDGVNLLLTVVHELGHSLGLDHSTHMGAIMYPSSRAYDPNLRLHQDDINAIQKLYSS